MQLLFAVWKTKLNITIQTSVLILRSYDHQKITMWNKEDQINLQGYLEPGIITAIDFDL